MDHPQAAAGHLVNRPRRLRLNAGIRKLVCENALSPNDLIYPLFVRHATSDGGPRPIVSMPGQSQWPLARIADEAQSVHDLGIPAVILFGIPDAKDSCGTENYSPDGIVPTAIRMIKQAVPDLVVMSDMCFCEYTDHGHCGIINRPDDATHYDPAMPEGYLLNDPTLDLLAKASVAHAEAGADVIAPSGMIDGMVTVIRQALDGAGFDQTSIMSYAAKYSSGFYGPFRDAAESPPSFGDRSQYQMDMGNRREALKEMALDVEQGADVLMVKPALAYLDIISDARANFDLPIAAYQVSGEYSMLHAAAERDWLDLKRTAIESLTAIKRAGADMILTYFAKDAVGWLASG
ncbi:MAG: porphobilinogen synthase [Planctomycetes bacterium]|nr:porphobilinogen synthase [Planctomycetota bacterium]NOG54140.1 porphobilinogen synthase [Planctomycetota bacterium]